MRICIIAHWRAADFGGPTSRMFHADVSEEALPSVIERAEEVLKLRIEGPVYRTLTEANTLDEPTPDCVREFTITDPVYESNDVYVPRAASMADDAVTRVECWLLWGRAFDELKRVQTMHCCHYCGRANECSMEGNEPTCWVDPEEDE